MRFGRRYLKRPYQTRANFDCINMYDMISCDFMMKIKPKQNRKTKRERQQKRKL